VNARKTFVIWIAREAVAGSERPILEGRIEEVDTGIQRKFRSADQLIALLEEGLSSAESGSTAL
jgi:hypothetical protein